MEQSGGLVTICWGDPGKHVTRGGNYYINITIHSERGSALDNGVDRIILRRQEHYFAGNDDLQVEIMYNLLVCLV